MFVSRHPNSTSGCSFNIHLSPVAKFLNLASLQLSSPDARFKPGVFNSAIGVCAYIY